MSPFAALRCLVLVTIFATNPLKLVAQAAAISPYFGVYFGTFDGGQGRWGMVVSWVGEGHFEFVGRFSRDGAFIRSYPYAAEVTEGGIIQGSTPRIDGRILNGNVVGEAALQYSVTSAVGETHVFNGQLDRQAHTGAAYAGYWRWPESRSIFIPQSVDAIVGPSGTTLVIVKTPERGEEDGMTTIDWDGKFVLTLSSGTRVVGRVDPDRVKLEATVSLGGAPSASVPATPSGKVINLSTLATIGPEQPFRNGFTIAGGTGKRLLLRAVGTQLSTVLGRGAFLADPMIEVESATSRIAANDDWNELDPELRRAIAEVGALPLVEGSRDAAMIVTFPAGNYAMTVRSAERDGSGRALAEIFDLEPSNGTLLNLSTQGRVGGSSSELISGFVVAGDQPRAVLVRGVGLKLRDLNTANADFVMDPRLEIKTSTGITVAANDNWSSLDAPLLAATQTAGAYRLDPGSRDAAVLVTLPPGAYTATVRSVSGAAGAVRVEIYDSEIAPAKTNVRLVIDAFTVAGVPYGDRFGYQPRIRLIETGGVSEAIIVTISFNIGEGIAGRVPRWSPRKTVPAGGTLDLIGEGVYGMQEFEMDSSFAADFVSVVITYRDRAGGEDSISALARVTR